MKPTGTLLVCPSSWNWRMFACMPQFMKLTYVCLSAAVHETDTCLLVCSSSWNWQIFACLPQFMKLTDVCPSASVFETDKYSSWNWPTYLYETDIHLSATAVYETDRSVFVCLLQFVNLTDTFHETDRYRTDRYCLWNWLIQPVKLTDAVHETDRYRLWNWQMLFVKPTDTVDETDRYSTDRYCSWNCRIQFMKLPDTVHETARYISWLKLTDAVRV